MFWKSAAHAALLFCACFLLSGCKVLDEVKPQLPEETQEGKHTFGCYVDGALWLPYTEHTLDRALEPRYDAGYFTLRAEREIGDVTHINMQLSDSTGFKLKTYTRDEGFYPSVTISDNGQSDTYTVLPAGGEASITLTKAEEPAPDGSREVIFSGRFSFVAVSSFTGKQVRVTDGRFDLKLR